MEQVWSRRRRRWRWRRRCRLRLAPARARAACGECKRRRGRAVAAVRRAAALHRCLLLSIARRLAQEFALCSPRLRDSLLEKLLLLADDGRLLRFRLGCACPTFFRYPANLVTCGLQLGLCFAQTCCTALTLLPHDHRTVASGREQLLRSREFFDEILVQLLAVC